MQRLAVHTTWTVHVAMTARDLETLARAVHPTAGPQERTRAFQMLLPFLTEARPHMKEDVLFLFERAPEVPMPMPERPVPVAGLAQTVLAPIHRPPRIDALQGVGGADLLTCVHCLQSAMGVTARGRRWVAPDLCNRCAEKGHQVPDDDTSCPVCERALEERDEEGEAEEEEEAPVEAMEAEEEGLVTNGAGLQGESRPRQNIPFGGTVSTGPFAGYPAQRKVVCARCGTKRAVYQARREGWPHPELCAAHVPVET